jgi:hypothetical protein
VEQDQAGPRRAGVLADATALLVFLSKISGTRCHEPSAQDAHRRIAAFFGRHLKT